RKLAEYGLSFVLSQSPSKFLIQKKENDFFAIQYPYSSIADTLQRFIFYLAAVESNTNSVLIFEEPEVHSFPPYVKELAERMILKDDNQYFVSTHSPYLLQTFIDSLDHAELNVYLTYYRNYQTHVKALSAEELRDIQDFGYDVFFNLRKFEPNE
ncbi:MAG: ATPase, partial [Bacteroidetes bacterium]